MPRGGGSSASERGGGRQTRTRMQPSGAPSTGTLRCPECSLKQGDRSCACRKSVASASSKQGKVGDEAKSTASNKEGKRKAQQISSAVKENVRQLLECPICCDTMCPPIYQCTEGHAICNVCVRRVQKCPTCRCTMHSNPIRNRVIEHMAEHCDGFNCTYHLHGCEKVMLYSELAKHQATCEYRPLCCPHGESRVRPCSWAGKASGKQGLIAHLQTVHDETFNALSLKPTSSSGKKRTESLRQWQFSVSISDWQGDFVANFSHEDTDGKQAHFRLQYVWKRFPDKRSSEYRSFISVRFLGEQADNPWFVELVVGLAEEHDTCVRRMRWQGRVHSSRYAVSDLEKRGEGMYINGRQLHFLTSTVSGRDAEGRPRTRSGPLDLCVLLHRDANLAALPVYAEPLPLDERAGRDDRSEQFSTFAW